MPASRSSQVKRLLTCATSDPGGSSERLLPIVYDELRSLARGYLRAQRGAGHTLQTTALVHEAYMRLAADTEKEWECRAHFFAVAARAMRQIIADRARRRGRVKRGGGWGRVTLSEVAAAAEPDVDVGELSDALNELELLDERKCRLVEFRFFAGMTVQEIAHVLDVSISTVEREWRFARAWLVGRLRGAEA